jgi:hypothetical protein
MPLAFEPTVETTIAGLARSFEVVLERQDLTIQKYRVLAYLALGPGSPSELAYRLTVQAGCPEVTGGGRLLRSAQADGAGLAAPLKLLK